MAHHLNGTRSAPGGHCPLCVESGLALRSALCVEQAGGKGQPAGGTTTALGVGTSVAMRSPCPVGSAHATRCARFSRELQSDLQRRVSLSMFRGAHAFATHRRGARSPRTHRGNGLPHVLVHSEHTTPVARMPGEALELNPAHAAVAPRKVTRSRCRLSRERKLTATATSPCDSRPPRHSVARRGSGGAAPRSLNI